MPSPSGRIRGSLRCTSTSEGPPEEDRAIRTLKEVVVKRAFIALCAVVAPAFAQAPQPGQRGSSESRPPPQHVERMFRTPTDIAFDSDDKL